MHIRIATSLDLSDFRFVKGFKLPFKVEAGNMFGTSEHFTFFKAEVEAIRFPGAEKWKKGLNSYDCSPIRH